MPVYALPDEPAFPHPSLAEPGGLLGIGGDLSIDRLLLAYAMGIFPWYSDGDPVLWFSPDPRFVLKTAELKVGRSLRKRVRRGDFRITLDQAFVEVIRACRSAPRPGQDGTWITDDMVAAYTDLHAAGFAHSVEAWRGERLVGGLYGVSLGRSFSGESMFAREADASKVAFVWLVRQLERWGFPLVDCQMETPHLSRFGGRPMPRAHYLRALRDLVVPPIHGREWSFDNDFHPMEVGP